MGLLGGYGTAPQNGLRDLLDWMKLQGEVGRPPETSPIMPMQLPAQPQRQSSESTESTGSTGQDNGLLSNFLKMFDGTGSSPIPTTPGGDDGGLGFLGGGAGGGAGGGGSSGLLGGAGAPLGFAALIGAGKTVENNNANNPLGRGLLSGLGPSISQMVADPKLAATTAFGVPFLNGFIRSDKAANTKPEWASLFG